ncbi:hypothetical protein F5148DRAFT_1280848 [Russula earlei]|uniref:Uncharacterized protein n=1 Tax=Russula earlei TaxID=71964 RepID=A0ACC0UIB3_9AGAM|nr:hypothetical protein F5148DRAFT_1280848 [Russula earlei]
MNSYPDMVTETNWAKATWKAGCKEKDVNMVPNVNHLCIIMAQSGHLHGDVKTKAKDAVANVFNFQHTYNLTITANQCTQVAKLKHDFTYIYQQTTGQSSFSKSHAIQDIINKVWFQNSSKSKPDTIIFHDQYDPFPLVAIVLTLPVTFTVADYKHVFEDVHEMLQSFDQATKDLGILLALQKAIFTGGCVYGRFDAEEGLHSHQNSLSEDAIKKAIEEHQNGVDWSNNEDIE